jgi:ferredoxin
MSLLGKPRFRESRCTRYRFRYSECRRCADACPHEAIELHDAGARIDAARCQNCSLCVVACHTSAWDSASFQPVELLRQAVRQPAWSVACAPAGSQADAVVPCLGALPAATLAYLARRGIAVSMRGAGHCGECVHGSTGAARLAANLQAVAILRDAVACDGGATWAMPAVDSAPGITARNETRGGARAAGVSRRQLMRRLVGRAAEGFGTAADAPPAAPPDKAIRAAACFVPEQRELLQIVCERGGDVPMRLPIDDVLPLMQVSLEPGCTLCEACFRVCPTGALQIDENPGDWALTFQADRCVACLACLEVCQPKVLQADATVDARPGRAPRRLFEMNKQRCRRCDRHFVSARPQAHCAVCSDDEDAFAAIFG